jgi:hypothetical protein
VKEAPKRCPTCGRYPKRSSEQNRRYWALVGKATELMVPVELPDGSTQMKQFDREAWHAMFKDLFLTPREVELPNGHIMLREASSAVADTPEFGDYMTQVEAYLLERFGVFLED